MAKANTGHRDVKSYSLNIDGIGFRFKMDSGTVVPISP